MVIVIEDIYSYFYVLVSDRFFEFFLFCLDFLKMYMEMYCGKEIFFIFIEDFCFEI